MPKYYTPKRPAVRFANSGSAMQTVSTQRVEKITETPSDHATNSRDFSGAPRIPRRSYDTAQAYNTASALAQPMAFPMGPAALTTTGSNFIRYSWRPVTDYLQAEQHGIYNISAGVASIISTRDPAAADRWAQLTASRQTSSYEWAELTQSETSSDVILEVYATAANSASEVVQGNAFLSGSELIESMYGGLSSIYYSGSYNGIYRPSYYAKTAGLNNTSLRTVYSVAKHVVTVDDLIWNPPASAPSASALFAPALTTAPAVAANFKGQIGLLSDLVISGSMIYLVTDPFAWTGTPAISSTADSQTKILAAATGNIVYFPVTSASVPLIVTASVRTSIFDGTHLSMTLGIGSEVFSQVTATVGGLCYIHSWVPLQDPISGTYVNNTMYDPAKIPVSVKQSGRIRDIRAWVEFIHDYRDSGSYNLTSESIDRGLQGVSIALRSPNTNFRSSHPLWNSNTTLPLRTETDLSGNANKFGNFYYDVPELMKNSYLLWQGHGVDDGMRDTLSPDPEIITNFYHEFDRDMDMRTVFWDGSPVRNPRDISDLYPSSTVYSTGTDVLPYTTFEDVSQSYYQSPTWGAMNSDDLIKSYIAGQTGRDVPALTGTDIPWMLDTRVDMGMLEPLRSTSTLNALSPVPPGGWLTGRGGMLPWQPISSTFYTTENLGPGDKLLLRPTKQRFYIFGGRNSGGTPNFGVRWGSYMTDEARGQLFVSQTLSASVLGLPGAAYGYQAFSFFNIVSGSPSISDNDKDRVIMVGGAQLTGTGGCNEVFVGHWVSASDEITWVRTTPLPTPLQQHNVYVTGGYVFVSPGVTKPDDGLLTTRVSAVFSAPIDQETGLVGSWTKHNFPGVSLSQISNVIIAGSSSVTSPWTIPLREAISTDGGVNYAAQMFPLYDVEDMAPLTQSSPGSFIASSKYGQLAYSTNTGSSWTWTDLSYNSAQADNSRRYHAVLSSSIGAVAVGNTILKATSPWAGTSIQHTLYGNANIQNFSYSTNPAVWTSTNSSIYGNWAQIGPVDFGSYASVNYTFDNSAAGASRTYAIEVSHFINGAWSSTETLFSTAASAGEKKFGTVFFSIPSPASIALGVNSSNSTVLTRLRIHIFAGSTFFVWSGTAAADLGSGVAVGRPDVEMYAACQGPTPNVILAVGGPSAGLGPVDPTVVYPNTDLPNNIPASPSSRFPYGSSGNRHFLLSNDGGTTWTSGVIPDGTSKTWYSRAYSAVIYAGGYYIAGEYYGKVVRSSDGINWTPISNIPASGTTAFAYAPNLGTGHGRLLAVGKWYYKSSTPTSSKWTGWAYYSDDLGATWNSTSVVYWPAPFLDTVWTGQYFIVVGESSPTSTGVVQNPYYSTDGGAFTGYNWFTNTTVPSPFNVKAVAFTTATLTIGNKQPLFSFFDTLSDDTGSIRSFGWTTYDTANESGILTSNSVLTTFRYELTTGAGDWNHYNDDGIFEVSSASDYYPTFVDNAHRAWSVGAWGASSQYSQISWDTINGRPRMFPATAAGLANNQNYSAGYAQFRSSSITYSSGVLLAGLSDPNFGLSNSQKIAGMTAFFGVGPGPDEFETYGYQFGPANIRPVYPIMDDVYAYKLSDQAPGVANGFHLASNHAPIIGYRPGLRSTEISGTWNFMFGTAATHSFDINSGYAVNEGRGIWLRQVRIESVVDQGVGMFFQNPARARLYNKTSLVMGPDGPSEVAIESGSAAWDIGLVGYQTIQLPDYGRTVSISSNPSGTSDDYAVLSFITGDLYTALSSSGVINPSWFLQGNGFGTPYIPDSLMSLGTGTAEQIDAQQAQELYNNTINIQKTVTPSVTTQDLINKSGITKTTLDLAQETVLSQSQSSGSGYFPGL